MLSIIVLRNKIGKNLYRQVTLTKKRKSAKKIAFGASLIDIYTHISDRKYNSLNAWNDPLYEDQVAFCILCKPWLSYLLLSSSLEKHTQREDKDKTSLGKQTSRIENAVYMIRLWSSTSDWCDPCNDKSLIERLQGQKALSQHAYILK